MTRSIKNLIAAVLVAVSGYLAWTQVLPAYTVQSFLEDRLEEKRALVQSRSEIIKKINDLHQETTTRFSEFQRLGLVAPTEKNLPEVISAVEKIYAQTGVILPELSLSEPRSRGGEFNEIFFETNNVGTYGQLVGVLSLLEKNIRILDVEEFSINLSQEARRNPQPDPNLSLTLRGKFYWLRPATTTTRTK